MAEENELVIHCQYRPGSFIIQGAVLAVATPKSDLSDHVVARIGRSFLLGHRRTYEQDVVFALDQLVEIGVRALSPGINDPFTAMMCLDHLGSAISRVGNERSAPRCFFDSAGNPRLVEVPFTKEGLVGLAFNQIREQGSGHISVIVHLLETLRAVAQQSNGSGMNLALLCHAELVLESYRQRHNNGHDLNILNMVYRTTVESIRNKSCSPEGPE